MRRAREEADTLGFGLGFALIVTGVAMVSIPAAFILAGVLVCAGASVVAFVRLQIRQRRKPDS